MTRRTYIKVYLALMALLAGAALGIAFASEWWGGLVPCALCLVGSRSRQR